MTTRLHAGSVRSEQDYFLQLNAPEQLQYDKKKGGMIMQVNAF